MAGEVVDVGSDVKSFRKGDAVWAYTQIATPGTGTFAEYCLTQEIATALKPPKLKFEEAATLGLGMVTSADAIFRSQNIPLFDPTHLPEPKGEYFLVWGASSSVGQYSVQLARRAGYTVIAVCSPKNFAYIERLGATHLVDRNSPDAVRQVKKFSDGKLYHAVDVIGTETANECVEALSTDKPSHLSTIAGGTTVYVPRNTAVHPVNAGDAYNHPDYLEFIHSVYGAIIPLLISGELLPNRFELLHRGLASVREGLERLANNKVSGHKLVLHVHQNIFYATV